MFLIIVCLLLALTFLILGGLTALAIRLSGRKGRTGRVFKWTALIFVVGLPLIVLVGFPLWMAHQLSTFGTRGFDLDLTSTPETYGCAFEEASFSSRDGVKLSGWWMAGSEDHPILVITHGLFRDRKEVAERGCRFNREGYGVLVYDQRHHGRSGGSTTSLGYLERLDMLGAYDFVRTHSSGGVILMGVSMGATAAILALPDSGPDVVGVVGDSPFLSLSETVDRHIGLLLGLPAFPFSPIFRWEFTRLNGYSGGELDCRLALRKSRPVPVLLIYGEEDQRMPRETAEAVYGAIPSPDKELIFFAGASHGAAFRSDPDGYTKKVLEFVRTRIEKKQAPSEQP